jgi:hypothetical protein
MQGEVVDIFSGPLKMSTTLINDLCRMWGLTMRKATTAAQHLPADWETKVKDMNYRIAILVYKHKTAKVSALQLLLMQQHCTGGCRNTQQKCKSNSTATAHIPTTMHNRTVLFVACCWCRSWW